MSFHDGLDSEIWQILFAQIRNLWTHTSTALEGNSLTLGETAFVLEEGLTISGKPLKDHQEVYGHAKAIDLIYRMLDKPNIDENDLFALHQVVLTERITDIYRPVGRWKNEPNYTSHAGPDGRQAWRQYPDPRHVPQLMAQWLRGLGAVPQERSAPEAARAYAALHLEFVTVHPFFDGNGRMARLLANIPVLKAGHPPLVIPATARAEYIARLSDYQQTIPDLAALADLDRLPANAEREAFTAFCEGHWAETLHLVAQAHEMQRKREALRAGDADSGPR